MKRQAIPSDYNALSALARDRVRRPAVAGRFYPAPPKVLRAEVEKYLREAELEPQSGIRALVSPHAGYPYSGPVAGAAYAAVARGAYKRVIVVAPSHQTAFDGVSLFAGEAYQTPLGNLGIDLELGARLAGSFAGLLFVPTAHEAEHSLEVQLPFVQVALGDVKLLPLVMGSQDETTARGLGEALAAVVDTLGGVEQTLLIASSDLSHYHEDSVARVLDGVVTSHVRAFDPEGLLESIAAGRAAACGAGPIVCAMHYARAVGAENSRVLSYATSGDTSGDRGHVVGYLAAAFLRPVAERTEHDLDRLERRELLCLARNALEAHYAGQAPPELNGPSKRLRQHRGAFCTLTKRGNLRGCIGYVEPIKPLWLAVRELAVAAATGDPRFAPVHASELDELHIELSALSPLEPLGDPSEVVVGRHGLLIRARGRSGLLLPQVPVEQGWEREEFLDHTCLKAGLPTGCWRAEAELFTFTAQVFGE